MMMEIINPVHHTSSSSSHPTNYETPSRRMEQPWESDPIQNDNEENNNVNDVSSDPNNSSTTTTTTNSTDIQDIILFQEEDEQLEDTNQNTTDDTIGIINQVQSDESVVVLVQVGDDDQDTKKELEEVNVSFNQETPLDDQGGATTFNTTESSSMTEPVEDALAEMEEELLEEEAEAEREYAEEDAALEAEGYYDGTKPIGEDDDTVGQMDMEDVNVEGMDMGDMEDMNIQGKMNMEDMNVEGMEMEMEDADVDNNELQLDEETLEEIEEWKEATEEHDKEWFQEYERTHNIDPTNQTATTEDQDEVETEQNTNDEQSSNNVDPNVPLDVEKDMEMWEDLEEWQAATEEHDKEWFDEFEKTNDIVPTDNGIIEDNVWTGGEGEEVTEAPEVPSPPQRPPLVSPTEEEVDEDTEVNEIPSPPLPPPVASPTTSHGWNEPIIPTTTVTETIDCSGVLGQLQCGFEQPLAVYAVVAFVPLLLLCCLARYCCRPKGAGDARGEYRAVAARYGDMGYDNTFSDAMSDEEDDDFMNGHGDIEDDSWGKSGRRTLELSKIKKELKGGLSIEEING